MDTNTYECRRCGRVLPAELFSRDARYATGLSRQCKVCLSSARTTPTARATKRAYQRAYMARRRGALKGTMSHDD